MKLLASVCGVVVALTIVCVATGQEGEKRTIKRTTFVLIDAKSKGISEETVIKRIEVPERTVAKEVLLDVKDRNGKNQPYQGTQGVGKAQVPSEWVVKSVKMILADDT